MAYVRNPDNDWFFPDPTHGSGPSVGMVIVGNILYFNSNNSVGPSTIKGLDIANGNLVKTISVSAFSKTYIEFLVADQNGYLWVQDNSFVGGYAVYDPADNSLKATLPYPPEGLTFMFDSVNNFVWLSKDPGTVTAISSTTYLPVFDISVAWARGIGLDTDKNELWVRDNTDKVFVFDAATGTPVLNRTLSRTTANTSGEFDYVPEKKWMVIAAYNRYSEIWSTDTYTLVATLYSTPTNNNKLIKYYVPAFDSIGGSNISNPKWELIDLNLNSQFLDTPLLPALEPQYNSIIGIDSSIYLAGYWFGLFHIYKVAFDIVPPPCFHVTGAGGKNRCDGTPPITPIANNRNAPYV